MISTKRIAIIGTGYVGLVTGTCLSNLGHYVICVDSNNERIYNLNNGVIPIFEPGLDDLIKDNIKERRLEFTTDTKYSVENSEIIFISVGTPPTDDGSADIQYVLDAAKDISVYMDSYKVIVVKSTVPVGTCQEVRRLITKKLEGLEKKCEFDVVSNPEFLREGSAIYDFTHPDKIVVGTETEKALKIMKEVYESFCLCDANFIFTNIQTSEMIKYCNNAFLALKISFINEIANLCEKVDANIQQVAFAIGKDKRINPYFLYAGPGFGGSCFPKDTMAVAYMGKKTGSPVLTIEAAIKVNNYQKIKMAEKIQEGLGTVEGKTLAILGLTYKPKTNDMREAPSITIINELYKKGANFKVYDPEGIKEAPKILNEVENIIYCTDEYEAIDGSDAVVIITEWHQFKNLNLKKVINLLKEPYFFDLRNIYEKDSMKELGFKYFGVGV